MTMNLCRFHECTVTKERLTGAALWLIAGLICVSAAIAEGPGEASTLQVTAFRQDAGPVFSFRLRRETSRALPPQPGTVSLVPAGDRDAEPVDTASFGAALSEPTVDWRSERIQLAFPAAAGRGYYTLRARRAGVRENTEHRTRLGIVHFRHRRQSITFLPASPRNYAYPPDIAAWTDEEKERQKEAGREVLARLREAIRRGEPRFVFPKGHYRFDGEDVAGRYYRAAKFSGLRNMTIDGNGATIWLTRLKEEGFLFQDCENVTIRNLTFDRDPLPYAQGEIVAIRKLAPDARPKTAISGKVVFKLHPGFEESVRLLLPDQYGNGKIRIHIFANDLVRGFPMKETWCAGHSGNRPVTRREDGLYELFFQSIYDSPQEAGVEVGDLIALTPRFGRHSFRLMNSANVSVENVTVYSSSRNGFHADHLHGPSRFERYRLMRRPNTRRLVSSNSDGMHYKYCTVGPQLINCEIEGAMDDAIALPSMNAMVVDPVPENPKRLVIATRHPHVPVNVAVGTQLAIYRNPDCVFQGRSTAVAVEEVRDDPDLAALVEEMPTSHIWRNESVFHAITLDSPLSAGSGDFVITDRWSGDHFVFRSNLITKCWAHAIRATGNHGVIADNTIDGTWGIAFSVFPGWLIGVFSDDITIRGNRIRRTRAFPGGDKMPIRIAAGSPEVTEQLHSNFSITDNMITDCAYAGILVSNSRDVTLSGNTIRNSNQRRHRFQPENPFAMNLADLNHGIVVRACRNVRGGGNRIIEPGPHCRSALHLAGHNDRETVDVDVRGLEP